MREATRRQAGVMESDHKPPTISENSDAKPTLATPGRGGFPRGLAGALGRGCQGLSEPGGRPQTVGTAATDRAPQLLDLRIEARSSHVIRYRVLPHYSATARHARFLSTPQVQGPDGR